MRLKLVKTDRIRCFGCKAWIGRLPKWDGCELGKGWQCPKCGTTSISYDDGRPWGPRYRHWDELVQEFEEIMASIGPNEHSYREWILSTVVVDEEEPQPIKGEIAGNKVIVTRNEDGNWWALSQGEPGVVVDRRISEERIGELIEKADSWQRFISLACIEVFALAYTED